MGLQVANQKKFNFTILMEIIYHAALNFSTHTLYPTALIPTPFHRLYRYTLYSKPISVMTLCQIHVLARLLLSFL